MDYEKVWGFVAAERRAFGGMLAALSEEEWLAPSACPGWTVKDVSAHAIAHPQHHLRTLLPAMIRGGFDLNKAGLIDGQRRGRAPADEILRQFEVYADARRLPPMTTPLEALVDTLVHTQDAMRPLGRSYDMPPEAAAIGADRSLAKHQKIFGYPVAGVRLVASDVDWSHGTGPEVRAPMQELLLLVTGRAAAADLVEGDGVASVRVA